MTTDSGKAWQSVGDELAALGKHFKAHREQLREHADTGDQTAAEERTVRDGLDGFARSCRELADSVGDSLRDPAVHEEARRAAEAVFAALGTTFEELSARVRAGRAPKD